MYAEIPTTIRAAIAAIAANQRPNARVARSKAAAPYIREGMAYTITDRLRGVAVFRLTDLGREVANSMASA